jgi:four helix bundle protein
MEGNKNYLTLDKLKVYKVAKEYCKMGWRVYKNLTWLEQKTMGNQMISSIDSVGANIAEGYGRFHYLDKNRFYLIARGSLFESKYWVELLHERSLIEDKSYYTLLNFYEKIQLLLNFLIKSQLKRKGL